MVKINGLTYNYSSEVQLKFPDFSLSKGEQALILGQSGCGKTTLLHLLSGLLKPNSGDIDVENENISKMSGARLDNFRGANIGIVFQTPHFIEALTVKENLTLTQTLAGKSKDIDKVERLLADLGVESKLNSKLNALSVGEKQRVSIARALVNSPALILADEPTSALDNKNCDAVLKLVREQAKKHNSTLLIVTHDNRLKDEFDKRIEL
jgi:ABC-type lipoprotein export system ATPase subunit